jgi:UDP-2-acetamido-3-amino-2,3-dideoxy-glucuronate N-acetyltransferase
VTHIDPTSIVESDAVGDGTRIWHFCHVMAGAVIGRNCTLGQNVFIDRDVKVGDNVKIQNNVSIYRGVTVEDDVFVGPSAVFTNVRNPRSAFPKAPEQYRLTHIGRGVSIGANATIVCGVSIGQWAFVAAGSVVTKDVLPHALVKGVPAKHNLNEWVRFCGCVVPSGADAYSEYPCPTCEVR